VNALPLKAPVAMRHAKLIVNPDQVVRREILLRKGKYRIGRDPMNDIELDDSAVSFEHCELEISELGVTIRDLQSTNGVAVDGKRAESTVLQSGQTVRLGRTSIRVEFDEIRVAIPEQTILPQVATSVILSDGSLSCLNHPETPGVFRCEQCGALFCASCVRSLRRISGGALYFCPVCPNALCAEIEWPKRTRRSEKLRAWLRKTLHISARP